MASILIASVCGEHLISPQSGEKLADALRDISAEEPIELDFSGIKGFAASFFCPAFEHLCERSAGKVSLKNAPEGAADLFSLVLKQGRDMRESPSLRDIAAFAAAKNAPDLE